MLSILIPVFAAALASMLVSMFYYSQSMMGEAWMKEARVTEEDIINQADEMGPLMVSSFILSLCSAVVMYVIFDAIPVTSIKEAVIYALLLWAGFFCVTNISHMLFEQSNPKLLWIKCGHQLISFVVMGIVIVLLSF